MSLPYYSTTGPVPLGDPHYTVGASIPLTSIFWTDLAFCSNTISVSSGVWSPISNTWDREATPTPICTRATDPGTFARMSSCYPSGFNLLQSTEGIYAPGVCPYDYSAAAKWTVYGVKGTTSICCPLDMRYLPSPVSHYGLACVKTISSVSLFTTDTETTETFTYTGTIVAAATAITVAWAPGDLKLFKPASAPLGVPIYVSDNFIGGSIFSISTTQTSFRPPPSSASSSSSSSSRLDHASSSASSSPGSGDSLSTGAQAGIGVGVAIAALCLLGLGIWALRRRKKKPTDDSAAYVDRKPELEGKDADKKPPLTSSELDPQGVAEMTGRGKPGELHEDMRHELPTDWQGYEVETSEQRAHATSLTPR